MNLIAIKNKNGKRLRSGLILTAVFLILVGCNSVDPRNVDVELKETAPVQKLTNFTDSLADLGLMSEIYGTGVVRIQSQEINDKTGASASTGSEIQRNITEIMKSTLNTIGGNVVFIPYDPSFIQNQMVTGYSSFDNKVIPDVVISGGITEFDRGLETRGEGTDVGAEVNFSGMPDWLPSKTVGIDYGGSGKTGLARITLDFNMLDFQTMTGIPRMNTQNSMEVGKAVKKKELGITLFGPTFGLKGSVKKVQGRHAAVRTLVEVSMIQMVGKYMGLPYWRLLGDDAQPDKIVLQQIEASYYRSTKEEIVGNVQTWLFLHGFDVPLSSQLDAQTIAALQQLVEGYTPQGDTVDVATYTQIYTTIPVSQQTLGRRNTLVAMFEAEAQQEVAAAPQAPAPQAPEPAPAPQVATQPAPAPAPAPVPAPAPAPQVAAAPQPAPAPVPAPAPAPQVAAAPQPTQPEPAVGPAQTAKKAGTVLKRRQGMVGRMLRADEW